MLYYSLYSESNIYNGEKIKNIRDKHNVIKINSGYTACQFCIRIT